MEDDLRATLEAQRDQYRAKLARVERWLAELDEEQPEASENMASGEPHVSRQPKGELKEHHIVGKSIVDAAKEVLRYAGKAMSSYEITQTLQSAGYNFDGKQPVKSVGKSLRLAATPGSDVIYNAATGNYSLKTG